jgi:Xaa-Pro aminopeptidase
MNMNERVNTPISTAELERRWAAVRAAMAERGIDALLLQANNDFMGGYVKWFTDLPATNGYPATVVFPREERMTVIGQGPLNAVTEFPEGGDVLRRGVARFMGSPSFVSAGYSMAYDAQLAGRALAPWARGTIGLVGPGGIGYALVEALRKGTCAQASFVDASELVDTIKAVKSDEEIALLRRTARMQDACWDELLRQIRPGMTEIEAAGIAEQAGRRQGSEQGLFLASSAPVGTAQPFANRHLQNRVLRAGDWFSLLIESSGPGGFYTELGRTCVLGHASAQMKEENALVQAARRFTLERLVPGASGPEIWEAYNAWLRAHGRAEERRVHCHGQGYDMVERPLVRHDETLRIGDRMVLACHPSWTTATTFSWLCDDYLVRAGAAPQRLHETAETIFEVA